MGDGPLEADLVEELAQHLNLTRFHTYGLLATARDEYEVDDEHESRDHEDPPADMDRIKVETGIRRRATGLDFRLDFSLSHPGGQIAADIGALYECAPDFSLNDVSDEVVIEFGDRFALLALYPYFRYAIGDLGRRVGVDIVLPMLRHGDLTFAPTEEADE